MIIVTVEISNLFNNTVSVILKSKHEGEVDFKERMMANEVADAVYEVIQSRDGQKVGDPN